MKKIFIYFQKNKKLSLPLALIWTLIIIIGCSLPGKDLPKIGLFDHFDKVIHFVFFAVFLMLWYFYFNTQKNILLILILISATFGFLIEWYQLHFVEGRSFDIWDGIFDTIGAMCAAWFVHLINKENK